MAILATLSPRAGAYFLSAAGLWRCHQTLAARAARRHRPRAGGDVAAPAWLVSVGLRWAQSAGIPGVGAADQGERYFSYLLRHLHRTWQATPDVSIVLDAYWTGMTANSAPAYQAGNPRFYRVVDGVMALMNFGAGGNVVGPMLGMNLAHALADDRPQDILLPLEAPVALGLQGRFEFKIRRVMIPLAHVIDRFERIRL